MKFFKNCLLAVALLATTPAMALYTYTDTSAARSISVWDEYNLTTGTFNVYFTNRIFTGGLGYDGGSWTAPAAIGNTANSPRNPVAGINPSGNMGVIWSGTDTITYSTTLYARVNIGGSWSAIRTLSSPATHNLLDQYNITVADNNCMVATWNVYVFATGQVETYASYFNQPLIGTGVWTTPVLISNP